MARVRRGVAVRILYSLCIAIMTALIVVMYEGRFKMSGFWLVGAGIVALIIEGVVTKRMTQGFDWKW